MDKLTALSPCAGLLPLKIAGLTLSEQVPAGLTLILPMTGQGDAVSRLLQNTHGVAFPQPNAQTRQGDVRCLWFGRDQAMLIGPTPDPALAAHASVVDQSDAWAIVSVQGDMGPDVLARLVPLDLRASVFGINQTARTLVGHMTASVTRTGPDELEIMVFRSMAATLVHELETSATQVAARAQI